MNQHRHTPGQQPESIKEYRSTADIAILLAWMLVLGIVLGSCNNSVSPGENPPDNPQVSPPDLQSVARPSMNEDSLNNDGEAPSSPLQFQLIADLGDTTDGLVVYLHGDGADEYSSFGGSLDTIAGHRKMAALLVRAPDSALLQSRHTGEIARIPSWQAEPVPENAQSLDSLIRFVIGDHLGVNTDKVIFVGTSGGAYFLTEYFMSLHGDKYAGGAILLCGGNTNTSGAPFGSQGWRSSFPLYYYTHSQDPVISDVRASALQYDGLGFPVTTEFPLAEGHCNFSLSEELPPLLDILLEEIQ